jgi:hypothetical protein
VIRASIFILTSALALVNVLIAARVADRWVKLEDLPVLAGIAGAIALAVPAIAALALGAFVERKSRFTTRYVLAFALTHVATFAVLFEGFGLGLEDASLALARLRGEKARIAEPPVPPPPPPAAADDAGVPIPRREPTVPDAGVVFEWIDDDGSVSFAETLDEIPEAHRGRARPIPMAPERPPIPEQRVPPPDRATLDDAGRAVRRLNEHRSVAKLAPVALDRELSRRVQLHADYLAANAGHPSLAGLGVHAERPDLPGYSKDGDDAGKASVITFDTRAKIDPVDKWIGTFFHRVPLLAPNLGATGFGYAESRDPKVGHIWILHVGTEPSGGVVVYPADGQTDVPTRFSGNETPNPIPHDEDGAAGFPITLTFPPKAKVRGVSVSFEAAVRGSVEHYLSTPESPVIEGQQRNTICIIAEDPLEGRTAYAVDVAAIVDGQDFRQHVGFTTARD